MSHVHLPNNSQETLAPNSLLGFREPIWFVYRCPSNPVTPLSRGFFIYVNPCCINMISSWAMEGSLVEDLDGAPELWEVVEVLVLLILSSKKDSFLTTHGIANDIGPSTSSDSLSSSSSVVSRCLGEKVSKDVHKPRLSSKPLGLSIQLFVSFIFSFQLRTRRISASS